MVREQAGEELPQWTTTTWSSSAAARPVSVRWP